MSLFSGSCAIFIPTVAVYSLGKRPLQPCQTLCNPSEYRLGHLLCLWHLPFRGAAAGRRSEAGQYRCGAI